MRRRAVWVFGLKGKKGNYFAHTLNNTVVAPPRMLIAFLENNLCADGSVKIPEALRMYIWAAWKRSNKKGKRRVFPALSFFQKIRLEAGFHSEAKGNFENGMEKRKGKDVKNFVKKSIDELV